jgi:hypothetical protein
MRTISAASAIALVVAGLVVTSSFIALTHVQDNGRGRPQTIPSITLWQAYARGLVTITMVNLTFHRGGSTVTEPAGIRVTNAANVSVIVPEEAVLMSPHPGQSPVPDPLNTTQDAVLTNATIPAGSSLTYVFGLYVLLGLLTGPSWWCLEEMQFTKAGVTFAPGGETLPFALRSLVEHPYSASPADNSQAALWAYFRHHASVVVEKLPLEGSVNASGGNHTKVRLDATNLAVWSTDDNISANVNVTGGVVEDDLLPGWSVEPGSYSVNPNAIVNHSDGSKTLRWIVDLPAAQVSESGNPEYPTPYTTVTRTFTIISPAINGTNIELPPARSDMNNSGTTDAHSAPAEIAIFGGTVPPPTELARAKIGVRLGGEEGAQVNLTVHANGTVLATLSVERSEERGRPNSASTPFLTFNLSFPVNLTLVFTPDRERHSDRDHDREARDQDRPGHDREHGEEHEEHDNHGGNPAWIVLKFPDGTKVVFFHDFRAKDRSNWTWNSGDLRPLFRALNETFPAGTVAAASPSISLAAQGTGWLAAAAANPVDPLPALQAKIEGQRVI